MNYVFYFLQCDICTGSISTAEPPVLMSCEHHFCRSCWKMWVSVALGTTWRFIVYIDLIDLDHSYFLPLMHFTFLPWKHWRYVWRLCYSYGWQFQFPISPPSGVRWRWGLKKDFSRSFCSSCCSLLLSCSFLVPLGLLSHYPLGWSYKMKVSGSYSLTYCCVIPVGNSNQIIF